MEQGEYTSSSISEKVRETQIKKSKEFLESILGQDLEPNFRPKHPCRCPKIAKLSDNQFIQEPNLKTTTNSKETVNDNIPMTVRNMEDEAPEQPRPQSHIGK